MSETQESDILDNIGPVILIMLMRLYDTQMTILGAAQPDLAAKLLDMHTRGEYFCPPPALAYTKEGEESEST